MTRLGLIAAIIAGAISFPGDAWAVSLPSSVTLQTLSARTPGLMAITIAPVGQGNCILISCPNGDRILHDCGSYKIDTASLGGARFINDILKHVPVHSTPTVKAAVLTHPHKDHFNLIGDALAGVKVETLILGGRKSDFGVLPIVPTKTIQSKPPHKPALGNNHPDLGCGPLPGAPPLPPGTPPPGISILSALGHHAKNANEKSLITRIIYNTFIALLTGDAEIDAETAAMGTATVFGLSLESDVLVVTHHGSNRRNNQPKWLSETRPNALVFSAGDVPIYGHPRCSTIAVFEAAATKRLLGGVPPHPVQCYPGQKTVPLKPLRTDAVFNTYNDGAVIIFTDGDVFSMWTCDDPTNLPACSEML